MAHFYGTVQGMRGAASRLGSKASGISARAGGWDVGASIDVGYSDQLDCDHVSLSATSGSSARGLSIYVGQIARDGDSLTFRPSLELSRALGIKYGKVGKL